MISDLIRVSVLRGSSSDAGDLDHDHFADIKGFRRFSGQQVEYFLRRWRPVGSPQIFVAVIQFRPNIVKRDAFVAVPLFRER